MENSHIAPSKARWNYAKSEAAKLANMFSAPPIPVLEIAENNGVDVVFSDFGTHTGTVAGFCVFGEAKLYVNSKDSTERQLFTIAHELGHWMLHKKIFDHDPDRYPVLPRFQEANEKDPLEQEANCFAANLLVPKRLLKPVKSGSVASLAKIFGVSRTMMEFRLKNV